MSNLQGMIEALKAAGYRMTPQRKAICQALSESPDHPSAQMLYEQLRPEYETLSLATVYNTLEALSRLGLVNVLGEAFGGESIRYDPDTRPHINLECVECHRIIDIESLAVETIAGEVARHSGFTLMGARVLYYGVCPNCQAKSKQV